MQSKRNLLLVFYVVLTITGMFAPAVYASSILEGTPGSVLSSTVYTADVKEGDSYVSVFGLNGDSTNYDSYGVVNINGGTVSGTVYGNRAINADNYVQSSNNKVNMTGGSVGTVYGGYGYGGKDSASVHNNEVNINGGVVTGYVYGGSSDGATISVTGNNVNISNAEVGRTVYGACAFNTESWLSMLRNNVVIENSTITGSVYGGYASGSSTAANSNKVTIKGNSTIKGSVYGGYAMSTNSDSKSNTVIIEGGTLTGHIYGGIGKNAKGNTIVIKGGDLSGADLYGYSDGRKSHSDNTLEIWTSDVKVKSAQNFENYYFIVPKDLVNNEDKYMLKADRPVNLSDSSVAVAVENGTELNVDDKINLIDKIEGNPALVSLEDAELRGGTQLTIYDFRLECTEGNSLIAIATSSEGKHRLFTSPLTPAARAIKEARSLLGGQIASIALLNKSTESTMDLAFEGAKIASEKKDGFATFLTIGGGKSRYFTDSHITINSIDLVLGLSRGFSSQKTEGTFSFSFETGHGDYTTFDSFDNGLESGIVFGNGNSHYFGGGLMIQLKLSEIKGLYLDAAGHIGDVNNVWNTDDIKNEKIEFNTNSLYFGTAAKIGYQINVGKVLDFDVFGSFIWTHQNGTNTDANKEHLIFKDMDSLKAGIGAKITYSGIKNFESHLELGYEREFNGEAQATVNNARIDAPTLKGNTGSLKLCVSYTPSTNSNWHLDLTANGYIGIRKGLNGSALVNVNL